MPPEQLSDVDPADVPVVPPAEWGDYGSGSMVTGNLRWYRNEDEFKRDAGKDICEETFERMFTPGIRGFLT